MDDGEKTTAATVLPDIVFVFQSSYKFPGFSMKKYYILHDKISRVCFKYLRAIRVWSHIAIRISKNNIKLWQQKWDDWFHF